MNIVKNEGYFEVASTGKPDHEEGLNNVNHHHNHFLPFLWRIWVCGFRGQYPREPPNRIRILRAILAY